MEKRSQEYYDQMAEELNNDTDPLDFNSKEVRRELQKRIIGRDEQIKSIVEAIKHSDKVTDGSKKENIIIAGPTGTGKSQTYKEIRKIFEKVRPVVLVDTSQLTTQGYIGEKLESKIFADAIRQAMRINKNTTGIPKQFDIELAQRAIVILDEIDKRATKGNDTGNINKEGVIDQLLTFIEGTDYNVSLKSKGQVFKLNSERMVILAGGAFEEYFEKHNVKKAIGFNNKTKENKKEEEFTNNFEVEPRELVKFGLSSQFIARFPKVVLYPPHNVDTLVELEENIYTSKIYTKMLQYKEYNVETYLGNSFIRKIAEKAYDLNVGGRALQNIVDRVTNGLLSEIEDNPGLYQMIYLSDKCVEDPNLVILIKRDGTYITMKKIKEKDKEELSKIKRIHKIKQSKENYIFVKNALKDLFNDDFSENKKTLCLDKKVI